MKGLFGAVLSFLFLANAVFSSPLSHADNIDLSPMKEINHQGIIQQHRWVMVPDGDYKMHLVDLNTYEPSDAEPFFNAANDVFFVLRSKRNPTNGERIPFNADAIRNTEFNPSLPTRFVIHGWNNEHTSDVNVQISAGYLNRGEFNVIAVDWGRGANTIDYISARNRINDVADVVANMIDFLVANDFVHLSELSVIGHSLGGHTAGLTGKRVTTGKIQTLVALDPAGPLFWSNERDGRITEDDGVYVEIIHTAGSSLGYFEPIGHADFYPNGGSSQPGCGIDMTGSCAHSRAYTFFSESLQENNRFVANRCQSYDEAKNSRCTILSSGHLMGGEPPNNDLRGYFHLRTNSGSPFAQG